MVQHLILIEDGSYNPPIKNIVVGDSVIWSNRDLRSHTATRTDKPVFDTTIIRPSDVSKVAVLFSDAGEFEYGCSEHPEMKGRVVVAAAANATGAKQKVILAKDHKRGKGR